MPTPSAHASRGPSCSRCEALCCRLTVVLQPEDQVASHLTATSPQGLRVMARGEDGWCVALNASKMNCGIYESRPSVCRRFVMDGPYCKDIRRRHSHPSTDQPSSQATGPGNLTHASPQDGDGRSSLT